MTTTRDTVGTMARSVADIIMFDDIYSDCLPEKRPPVPDVKGLRIGMPRQWWTDLDPEASFTTHQELLSLQDNCSGLPSNSTCLPAAASKGRWPPGAVAPAAQDGVLVLLAHRQTLVHCPGASAH